MSEDRVIVVPRGEHSPLGPSSSKRWIKCPGSLRAAAGAKDNESEYAAEGTAAHYLSELCRKENKFAIDWLDWTIKVGSYSFVVDESMCDGVQEFVDKVEEHPGTPLVEQRIDYSRYFSPGVIAEFGPAFGTLDDARLNAKTVWIVDFKFGKGLQEFAENNTQLMLQALGVLEDFGYLYEIEAFSLAISQPRLGHFDEWTISVPDLLKWAENLKAYGDAVAEGTEFNAGAWCQFCKIRSSCKVRAKSLTGLMLLEGEFEDLDQLEVYAMRARNRLQFITNDELAKILPALGDFTKWIGDVKKRAVSALIAKEEVGGWKLVAGRSGRKWLDEKNAAHKLQTLQVEPYKPQEVISVAVAEKTLGKSEFGRRFKLSEDFRKPPGKPALAPAEDKRLALDASTVNEFEDLGDSE